jgi:hypothetical protein
MPLMKPTSLFLFCLLMICSIVSHSQSFPKALKIKKAPRVTVGTPKTNLPKPPKITVGTPKIKLPEPPKITVGTPVLTMENPEITIGTPKFRMAPIKFSFSSPADDTLAVKSLPPPASGQNLLCGVLHLDKDEPREDGGRIFYYTAASTGTLECILSINGKVTSTSKQTIQAGNTWVIGCRPGQVHGWVCH